MSINKPQDRYLEGYRDGFRDGFNSKTPNPPTENGYRQGGVWPNPAIKYEGTSGCLHDNCPGCKNGTCSGVHMISCPCPKHSVRM